MTIPDSVLKRALANVYFLWGRGKTTVANCLRDTYGYYVYSTDDAKDRHWAEGIPADQPYMCRDFEAEYSVKDFWALPKEVIAERERHVQAEVTPMLITDLLALADRYPIVLCEGDIHYDTVIPIASHMVYLHSRSEAFDWFSRPDHDSLDSIRCRTDLTEAEKDAIIRNAYAATAGVGQVLPDWVLFHRIPVISWNDRTGIENTAESVRTLFDI